MGAIANLKCFLSVNGSNKSLCLDFLEYVDNIYPNIKDGVLKNYNVLRNSLIATNELGLVCLLDSVYNNDTKRYKFFVSLYEDNSTAVDFAKVFFIDSKFWLESIKSYYRFIPDFYNTVRGILKFSGLKEEKLIESYFEKMNRAGGKRKRGKNVVISKDRDEE